jgi:hypothetical protein
MTDHSFSKITYNRSTFDLAFVDRFITSARELVGGDPAADSRIEMKLGDSNVRLDGIKELQSLLLQLPKWQFPDSIDIMVNHEYRYISYKAGTSNFLYISNSNPVWVDNTAEVLFPLVKTTWKTFGNSWHEITPGKILLFQTFLSSFLFCNGLSAIYGNHNPNLGAMLCLLSGLNGLSSPFVNYFMRKKFKHTQIDLTLVPNVTRTKTI